MRMEGTGNLFGEEGWRITFDEKGLDEVDGVGMEVIRVAVDSLPLDNQREGEGVLNVS